ncbi:MAG TPA: hypothetical protein VFZ75_06505 [Actinomycetota bacterium]|nr:hypothetical protein [Actinomycetota bacterium]
MARVQGRIVGVARALAARRRYTCPRCHARIPKTVAKCYRCGWSDRVTTANLEAMGGFHAARGDVPNGPTPI